MPWHLNTAERRVLGSLMEKEMATPDYYPLTLNALIAACNQKSSREPVLELSEKEVRSALSSLQEKGMAAPARESGRVARFAHCLGDLLNLGRRESALLCTLLLRGAQTPGELRGRSERLHRIDELDEVQLVLQRLVEHDPPLVRLLPRQPGTKEARYADTLGGESAPSSSEATAEPSVLPAPSRDGLEAEVSRLREEVEELRRQFEAFRASFS